MSISFSSISAANAGALPEAETRVPKQNLGQDDFLKLLVAQFTTQDPLSPQADTEFVAQMAQFTSLEQTKTMQADIALMRADQRLMSANAMLGREVTFADPEGKLQSGVAEAVSGVEGTPKILVNGDSIDLDQILGAAPSPTGADARLPL